VLSDYADDLQAVNGRLSLAGVNEGVYDQLVRTGKLRSPVQVYRATPVVGESTRAALADAQAWLVDSSERR
jgi:sulfate permease, SulP family